MLAKYVGDNQHDWPKYLQQVALAHNTSRHETLGYSPYFLFHGREAIVGIDLLLETPPESEAVNYNEYAVELTDRLRAAYQFVQNSLFRKAS